MQQENEDVKNQSQKQLEKLSKDFEEIASRLKAKNDQKKKKLKEYSTKMKQIIQMQIEENKKWEGIREQLTKEKEQVVAEKDKKIHELEQ